MEKIAIYARVSTDEQRESLGEQKRILIEWCKEKKYDIVEIYEDIQSGKNTSRTDFQRMMNDVTNNHHTYKTVVILKLDRLSRSLKDLIATVDSLKEHDIGLVSKDDSAIDTTTSQGRLIFSIFGALAEFERELIGYRTGIGMKRAQREGKLCHRPRKEINVDKVKKAIMDGYTLDEIAKMQVMSFVTLKKRMSDAGLQIERVIK